MAIGKIEIYPYEKIPPFLGMNLKMSKHYVWGFSQTVDPQMARLTLKLEKIMNEKKSKRRIQIRDLQKQEIEEKQERRLLIRLHIFYRILLINL